MEKIYGIGMDQIEIDRVKKATEKKTFLERYFSEKEQELIKKRAGRCATNFAGKEAVVKAIRTGFCSIEPREIEILREESGAPYVRVSKQVQKILDEKKITKIHLTLTDTKTVACAYAIAVCGKDE